MTTTATSAINAMVNEMQMFSPATAEPDPSRVRRAKDGRPYIKVACPNTACSDGRVTGKREGTTKNCPDCKGKGMKEVLYTRCTSFVGVLEARHELEKWKQRIVLTGMNLDAALWAELAAADPNDRDALNSIADRAFRLGDGYEAAQKGTDLHELTTFVDQGLPLPRALLGDDGVLRPVSVQDRADMAAWLRITEPIEVVSIETFVVNDHYKIGGTYDRLVVWDAPEGHGCQQCDLPTILDLKTGRVDYGQGKIAQQLAVYANSMDYDPATGARKPQYACTHVGLVVHLPQGTGTATLYTVDLTAGWRDVALSAQVREHRRVQAERLSPVSGGLLLDLARPPEPPSTT